MGGFFLLIGEALKAAADGGHADDPALAEAVLALQVGHQALLGVATETADVSLWTRLEGEVNTLFLVGKVSGCRRRGFSSI